MKQAMTRISVGAADLIVGLEESGGRYPIGKLEAHVKNTRHLAVSVFVFEGDRLLLQRRAQDKYHSGGLWANTCCSHPRWGESPKECAERRLREELGFSVPLYEFAVIEYAARIGSLFENELVHCFRANLGQPVDLGSLDPAEVIEVAWQSLEQIASEIKTRPSNYATWFRIYMDRHFNPNDSFALTS